MSDIKPRERPVCESCGTTLPHPKDPPLQMPEGYSMMEMLERERDELNTRTWRKPVTQVITPPPPPKKKGRRRGK